MTGVSDIRTFGDERANLLGVITRVFDAGKEAAALPPREARRRRALVVRRAMLDVEHYG